MSVVTRWILHADLDAFYASVEQLDNPELRGKPVVVGGPPEARAVVTTASYEARPFGVRSAMPMSRALRLCPQAIRISPRFDRYGQVSRQVMAVFRELTPLVEPLSLDEAFLDVTARVSRYQGVKDIARRLKADVKAKTHLTVSIGAATNKTVAKIASDMQKPDGLVVVPEGGEAAFLAPLPVRAMWGVGPRAEETLRSAGFETIGQLAQAEESQLVALMGSRGPFLLEMARGQDDRPLETEHERKSVGAETTFPRDLPDGPELRAELRRVALDAARRLSKSGGSCRTVVLKLRYANFHTITRQNSAPEATADADEIVARAEALLDAAAQDGDMFRLIGVHCTNLAEPLPGGQMGLWADETPEEDVGELEPGREPTASSDAGPNLKTIAASWVIEGVILNLILTPHHCFLGVVSGFELFFEGLGLFPWRLNLEGSARAAPSRIEFNSSRVRLEFKLPAESWRARARKVIRRRAVVSSARCFGGPSFCPMSRTARRMVGSAAMRPPSSASWRELRPCLRAFMLPLGAPRAAGRFRAADLRGSDADFFATSPPPRG